jgi:RNA polymerase sigma-70 factor (ECF subfamily)
MQGAPVFIEQSTFRRAACARAVASLSRPSRFPASDRGAWASAQVLAIAATEDRDAFAALFTYFAPRVKAYLMQHGASAVVAEDLAQETMLVVWRKAAYFDPRRAGCATWIFTIARNLRIDALRRERRPEPELSEPPAASPAPPGPDDLLAAARRDRRVRDALQTLPEEQIRVVRLSFFQDKSHGEIALDLNLPLGTVKSRLRLAMSRLRARIGEPC